MPELPHTCRVALVFDIDTTPTIALTLARTRLAELVTRFHRNGITATPVRVDIHDHPNLNP